jgi:FMN phosphatase YigB (HAD superfamily)
MYKLEDGTFFNMPMLLHRDLYLIDTMVIDLDGTLYINKDGGGMTATKMNPEYYLCTVHYIMAREGVSEKKAWTILPSVIGEGGGTSRGLSLRYHVDRNQARNDIWGSMDPAKVIGEFAPNIDALRIFAARNVRLIELTSAPKVWRENANAHMGITDIFTACYDADTFPEKKDAFPQLASMFGPPSRMVSIGNQMETDIVPAHYAGMRIYHVTQERTLQDLVFGK